MASKGMQLMRQDLEGRPALGRGSWEHLIGRGWDPQQITSLGPHTGWQVGSWVQDQMAKYPNAPINVGRSGLYNIGAAQHWAGKGKTEQEIARFGNFLAGSPRGQATGRSGWEAGFTRDARDWLVDHFTTKVEEEQQQVEDAMWEERVANIPTAAELMEAMPQPKIRAGKDYATTGRSAQGMKIKKGTKFAEGGKRGTKGYFGRGAKFTGDTTPAMNIKGGGGGSASQASNTLNTV